MMLNTNNSIFILNILLLPSFVLLWTDFSETRLIKNGIYDLHQLQAFCPSYKILRGFTFEHPTNSTIRIAMNCIPLDKSIKYQYADINNNTRPITITNNSMMWLEQQEILCGQSQVLLGFAIFIYNNVMNFAYTCLPIPNSSCYNENTLLSKVFPFPNGDLKRITFPPIVASPYYGGLQGFKLTVRRVNEEEKWKAFISYSWCLFGNDIKSEEELIKSTGINVDLYFKYTDNNIDKVLDFLTSFKRIYFRFKDLISFSPHYIVNIRDEKEIAKIPKEEISLNCTEDGRYCLEDVKENTGKSMVMESLKQLCLGTDMVSYSSIYFKEMYFEYLYTYKTKCIHKSGIIDCGESVLDMYGVHQWSIEQCFQDNFEDPHHLKGKNKLFEREYLLMKENNIKEKDLPLIKLNNKITIYNLDEDSLIKQICKILGNIPQCKKEKEEEPESNNLWIILSVIFICFVIVGIILFVVLKLRKKKGKRLYLINKN